MPTPIDTPRPTSVRWVSTTRTQPWREHDDIETGELRQMPAAFVDSNDAHQEIEGFGATFNELGWEALSALDATERREVLAELFAPGQGLNLTRCRMPVGANDFSRDWYSYDETDGDLELRDFTIKNDLDTLVPFIQAAQEHQPELTLWASPWSPPSWMKTNGHYAAALPRIGNAVDNGLREDQVGHEGTDMMRLEEPVLDAYARYFGKFVDAYRELGISVDMVMPQNEFNSAQPFPSCTWTPDGLARFIRRLGPEMAARGVEVFLGTLERGNYDLVAGVLADDEARRHIAGVGAQWAGKGAVPFINKLNPELRIYQTEQECGDGRNDWRLARHAFRLMVHFLNHGASAYTYWNIALKPGGVSRWGWAQNSLVCVADDGTLTRNHELYVLKHVSHFVRPGAHVVTALTYTGHEDVLAFRNPDGEIVVVMLNDVDEEQEIALSVDGRAFTATLPADSLNTFVLPAA